MGIHGIYKEIGPGERIALSKLAVEKFEETGRPLRIAIDVSIWLFQIQASKGGTNPALRTFYYRLLRLISLSIHPIFVFDGPNKPPFKRNKRTGPNVASIPEFLAKQLLKQFGFPIHLAPGEAEAECALLQREGIVDAVLSEDVDTLMFGSGLTIRNWSPEQRTSKTPTHVNVYDAVKTKNGPSGLDREGMILVALMSGGDYVPEGIPGCGPKTACDAARAGFGTDLCRLSRNDGQGLREWRERLQRELKMNESKFFKRKHSTLKIPDDFPRRDILGYYTHPVISTQAGLDKLRRSINWDQDLDFQGLRSFTLDAFDWARLEGAKHFIRSLAPSLLVRHLRMRGEKAGRFPSNDIQAIREDEALLVKGIHGKRQHRVTDNTTEVRVSFKPIDLVKIDLSNEEPDETPGDRETLVPGTRGNEIDLDEELPLEIEDDAESGPRKRGLTKFDPHKSARVWVLETFVKVGVPLKIQDWEAGTLRPKRAATARDTGKTAQKSRGTKCTKTAEEISQVPIERFAKVTKPGVRASQTLAKAQNLTFDLPATSTSTTSGRKNIIDLLSSSPIQPKSTAPPTQLATRENSGSSIEEGLPSGMTKRRRRGPTQRSHALPSDKSATLNRPRTPPALDIIETLDLVDSPALPSPSHLPAKKAKTRSVWNPPVAHYTRRTSVTLSPSKARKSTLDDWRASASVSPTKVRKDIPPTRTALIRASLELQPPRDEVETLDLTLSSSAASPPLQPTMSSNRRRTSASGSSARPPLQSISSNVSRLSTGSSSSRPSSCTALLEARSKRTVSTTTSPRCTSLHLHKAKSVSPAIESLDLTRPSSPSHHASPAAPAGPQHPSEPIDFSTLSSPELGVEQPSLSLRRSPRNHKSSSLSLSLSQEPTSLQKSSSPPAARKARGKKKRGIILRKSLAGAWDFIDIESPAQSSDNGTRAGDGDHALLKGKERKIWRESEIEFLDLS